MSEPRELAGLVELPWAELTFPEEALPHEGSRRLLEFLGVKIVKTNEQIDADLQARFGERELTARCLVCPEWRFTGPASEATAAHVEHNRSAEHGRALLERLDHGERLDLRKPRGETMGEKTCEACGLEQAPTHGRYAGIGAACRRKGFYRKDGQIHPPPSEARSEPEAAAEPEPELVPELEAPPPSEPASEPEPEQEHDFGPMLSPRPSLPLIDVPVERKVSVEEVTERIVEAAKAVFEQRRVVAAEEQRLEQAIAEYRAATSEVVPELPA